MIYQVMCLATQRLQSVGLRHLITISGRRFPVMSEGMAYSDYERLHISIDMPYFRKLSREMRRAVIAHEVCHLVNHLRKGPRVPSHGKEFFKLYRQTGFLNAERKYRIRTGWPKGYTRFPRR